MTRVASPTSTCSCGATITWARNPRTGRSVPLVQVTEYAIAPEEKSGGTSNVVTGSRKGWISHFLTCPHRDRYTAHGQGTKPAGTPPKSEGA